MTEITVAIDKVDKEIYNKLIYHLFDYPEWRGVLQENLDEYEYFDEDQVLVFDINSDETYINNEDYSGRWQDSTTDLLFELTEKQLKQYLVEELLTGIQFHNFLVSLYLNEELRMFNV